MNASRIASLALIAAIFWGLGLSQTLEADPCGMVPPIYAGQGVPIKRIGFQETYVFFQNGVESIAIRPGFEGKVEEFGMLIPFPTPPEIRKLPDQIFAQIANAIDPPEVLLGGFLVEEEKAAELFDADQKVGGLGLQKEEVRVLRQEAVGMYEVAVLAAGSAQALQRWMTEHKFQYPRGMDKVTEEYIDIGWCFVAVKTKVGAKAEVDARPGQRDVDSGLPENSSFDGHVQAMGFRFKVDELVVPMRLSAFNDGDLRNIVYLLTDSPKKIRRIPEEYVVRQVSGDRLLKNLTEPLPIRLVGIERIDIKNYYTVEQLKQMRDPTAVNGAAKMLFGSDLLAVHSGRLSLQKEETEKEFLRISESFGLRGPEIDAAHQEIVDKLQTQQIDEALAGLKSMTLTVIDGDFPREVLAKENLMFVGYKMPARKNRPVVYDSKLKGPNPESTGFIEGEIDFGPRDKKENSNDSSQSSWRGSWRYLLIGLASVLFLLVIGWPNVRRRSGSQVRR